MKRVIINTSAEVDLEQSFPGFEGTFAKASIDYQIQKNLSEVESFENGGSDIYMLPLQDLPVDLPADMIIAALSPRKLAIDTMFIHPSCHDPNKLLKIKENSRVYVSSIREARLLESFRSDLEITIVNEETEIGTDTVLLKVYPGQSIDPNFIERKKFTFNPVEFHPVAGSGTMACLTYKENLDIRRALMQLHDRNTAKCTNVERKILRGLDPEDQAYLGAYCHLDHSNNFHVYASLCLPNIQEIIFASLSQTTHLGLDNEILEIINRRKLELNP